jgi:mRNA interferase MazF
VVSARYADTDRALITIVPHTTSLRGSQYEVPIEVAFLKPGAFCAKPRDLSQRKGHSKAG